MKTQLYTPHIFSLCALSVLGNAIILMPFLKSGGLSSILISAVLTICIILLMTWLAKRWQKNKFIFFIVFVFIGIVAIYSAATTFLDYVGFLKSAQMPSASIYLLAAVLLGVVVVFVLSSTSAIYKYCLLVAIIGALMIAICFVGGIRNFDFSILKEEFFKPNFHIKDFLRFFSSLAVIPFFVSLKLKDFSANPIFLSASTGFLVLILCLFQCALTLNYSSDTAYPYLKAVGVISSGSLFTRLDGFVYFLFFITSLIKITICIKTIFVTVSRLPFDKLP